MNITPNLAPAPWSARHFQQAAPVGKNWPWWVQYWEGVKLRGRQG